MNGKQPSYDDSSISTDYEEPSSSNASSRYPKPKENLDEREVAEREVTELANSETNRINCARLIVFGLIISK